jgi:predicted transcriptional regulator
MTIDVPIVLDIETVETCMKLMNAFKTRYLLAYNVDGEFKGVVTVNDVLSLIVNRRENVFDTTSTLVYETTSIEIF